MFTSLKAMPCSRVQTCPVRLTLRCVNLKNRNSKVTKREFKNVKKELFCVKTACEEVSKFGNELLQNFNDIKICSCNDTLDK